MSDVCLDCGKAARYHQLGIIRSKCPSGDQWGRYGKDESSEVVDVSLPEEDPTRRAGYVLAMAVLQSDLWKDADDELRAAVQHFTPTQEATTDA